MEIGLGRGNRLVLLRCFGSASAKVKKVWSDIGKGEKKKLVWESWRVKNKARGQDTFIQISRILKNYV